MHIIMEINQDLVAECYEMNINTPIHLQFQLKQKEYMEISCEET